MPKWDAAGDITRLQLLYSFSSGCVVGARPTYGLSASNASLLGREAGATGLHLTLRGGEYFASAAYKSNGR